MTILGKFDDKQYLEKWLMSINDVDTLHQIAVTTAFYAVILRDFDHSIKSVLFRTLDHVAKVNPLTKSYANQWDEMAEQSDDYALSLMADPDTNDDHDPEYVNAFLHARTTFAIRNVIAALMTNSVDDARKQVDHAIYELCAVADNQANIDNRVTLALMAMFPSPQE